MTLCAPCCEFLAGYQPGSFGAARWESIRKYEDKIAPLPLPLRIVLRRKLALVLADINRQISEIPGRVQGFVSAFPTPAREDADRE